MKNEIFIDKKFCGPAESGQGGYVSGLLGNLISGPAEVTLRTPPPLDVPLQINFEGKDTVTLLNGDIIVAQAQPFDFQFDIPAPPVYDEAVKASRSYIGFKHHAFPKCFVCGPERNEGDGLRIFPGQVEGRNLVAATWTPYKELADETGKIKPEFIWAALDCSGAFAVLMSKLRLIVLGKIAVSIESEILTGEKCIVTGWPLMTEGRKLYAGTAIFSESGKLYARAKATWIEIVTGK